MQVLTLVLRNIPILWDIMPCSLVNRYGRCPNYAAVTFQKLQTANQPASQEGICTME